jgi:hypothetical protein
VRGAEREVLDDELPLTRGGCHAETRQGKSGEEGRGAAKRRAHRVTTFIAFSRRCTRMPR